MTLPVALRSLLFVPGSRPEFFAKALASNADALIFDLEDSVPPDARPAARRAIARELAAPACAERFSFVRINHPERGILEQDLSVLAPRVNQAVLLPKVESPQDVEKVDARLAAIEREMGLDVHALSVMIVIESSRGLRSLFETIRSSPRIRGASLATAEQGDLMADLGGQWTPSGEALGYARGKLICDARAAQLGWLVDGAFMNLGDEAALATESRLARTYGFTGKVAIHPRQVDVINPIFAPTAADVERARGMIDAFREATARGLGAIRYRGLMVDQANIRWAEHVLSIAER